MLGTALCAYVVLMGPPADVAADLRQKYKDFNTAISRNDFRSLERWLTSNLDPKFVYRSKDGNSFGYQAFIDGLRDQLKQVEKVKTSTLKCDSVSANGGKARVICNTKFEGRVRFDGVPMRLTDVSTTIDSWHETPKGWRLLKSVQTKGNTQMFKE